MTFRMLASDDLWRIAEENARAVGLDKVTFTAERGGIDFKREVAEPEKDEER